MNTTFTSSDRVMLHLLMKGDRMDRTGGKADQDDIAANCGIGRTHVPRALKPLLADGLVEESRGRAPGRARRVKLYSLTTRGITAALALRERANEFVIEWIDDHGRSEKGSCVDALRRINDRLGASSRKRIPISLFLALGRKGIGWEEILGLSSSVHRKTPDTLWIPEGWKQIIPPDLPPHLIERPSELAELLELMERNEVCVIAGDEGAGKTTLVQMLCGRSGLRALWLMRGGDREYLIDPGEFDIMVMVGAPMIDITSTLIGGGRAELRDPRDDEWPEDLRSIPLLGILEGRLVVTGNDVMSLGGLGREVFVGKAVEMGMPGELALEYYSATRGLPAALSYLAELEPSVLSGLGTLDTEAALMSLMLGLRSRS
ncbi:MAG: winged helix DNA-binding protein [Candidatus Thermoplasmatota archaeon]|nr:winged helix DNA-binding protein [Candidatus Thermoplasmatota archaeon]